MAASANGRRQPLLVNARAAQRAQRLIPPEGTENCMLPGSCWRWPFTDRADPQGQSGAAWPWPPPRGTPRAGAGRADRHEGIGMGKMAAPAEDAAIFVH